jgi:hypothetical protein
VATSSLKPLHDERRNRRPISGTARGSGPFGAALTGFLAALVSALVPLALPIGLVATTLSVVLVVLAPTCRAIDRRLAANLSLFMGLVHLILPRRPLLGAAGERQWRATPRGRPSGQSGRQRHHAGVPQQHERNDKATMATRRKGLTTSRRFDSSMIGRSA